MFRGLFGWIILAILVIWLVTNPESAANLITTVIGWIQTAADSLGVFVNAISAA